MSDLTRQRRLDRTFAALAHPIRRELVERLGREGRGVPVSELAAPHGVSLVAVSRHLKVLREAGLVRREVAGRERLYRLDAAGLDPLAEWLEVHREFWSESLKRLARYVETQTEEEADGGARGATDDPGAA